jgi:phage-related protein
VGRLNIHKYESASGRDMIYAYLDTLPTNEKAEGVATLELLRQKRLNELTIKKWRGKVWEVYFQQNNRMFYITVDNTDIYVLHACRKQKNKTEKRDSDIVVNRAKMLGLQLSKKFI